jgi:alkylated DNA repair dioxygenase AlkB
MVQPPHDKSVAPTAAVDCVKPSSPAARPQVLQPGPGAELLLYREALGDSDSQRALTQLRACLPWTQQRIRLYGKQHLQPRLSCWIGDPHAVYAYSGTRFKPQPWPGFLLQLKAQLENLCGQHFNSVLCNAYRNGQDSMGWHADDEPELGSQPVIASYSLGATRSFQMRPKAGPRPSPPWTLDLAHDDLLLMRGPTQQLWQHSIPKRLRVNDWRINLTFRLIST